MGILNGLSMVLCLTFTSSGKLLRFVCHSARLSRNIAEYMCEGKWFIRILKTSRRAVRVTRCSLSITATPDHSCIHRVVIGTNGNLMFQGKRMTKEIFDILGYDSLLGKLRRLKTANLLSLSAFGAYSTES